MIDWFMVFNATFNNISVISVLLAEEAWISGENPRPAASHWQTLPHDFVSSTPRLELIKRKAEIDIHVHVHVKERFIDFLLRITCFIQ